MIDGWVHGVTAGPIRLRADKVQDSGQKGAGKQCKITIKNGLKTGQNRLELHK